MKTSTLTELEEQYDEIVEEWHKTNTVFSLTDFEELVLQLNDLKPSDVIKKICNALDLSDCELGASQQELVEDAVRSAVEQALS